MQTRRKLYHTPNDTSYPPREENPTTRRSKRKRLQLTSNDASTGEPVDFFDGLPEETVLLILCKLSLTATSPSDLISALLTCKRWRSLVLDPAVLSKASRGAVAVQASKWSESAHGFLRSCVPAGNLEACYLLGMIHFHCLEDRRRGIALLSRAAVAAHPSALYSLAVIQFNGSGGSKKDKDLRAGAALCAHAASLGHVAALCELGHCLQDGYGVRADPDVGRRCLLRANARVLAAFLASSNRWGDLGGLLRGGRRCSSVAMSDFGCDVPAEEQEGFRGFLLRWRHVGDHVRCSGRCGRVVTRRNEFRRCFVCGTAKYCSRACQSVDWTGGHRFECVAGRADVEIGILPEGDLSIWERTSFPCFPLLSTLFFLWF